MRYASSDGSVVKQGSANLWKVGAGVVLEDARYAVPLGEGTVNTAEFSGILLAAYACLRYRDNVVIQTDSQFCANLINGRYDSRKFDSYLEAYRLIESLYRRMGLSLTVRWVPREQNQEADEMARASTSGYKSERNHAKRKNSKTKSK